MPSRRDFVGDLTRFGLAATIVPRHVLGRGFLAPSDKLNIACVGIGGMGMNNMSTLVDAGENIVAVCDVDFPYVERGILSRTKPRDGSAPSASSVKLGEAYTNARKYDDFRVMLEKERANIDAVVIATADHTHAVIANAAMKAGKHVYVQKPLTYSVHEARTLARTAREMKVVTQMGNQGHSGEGTRRIVEIVNSGVLGPVREVHVWTDRPQRYWAQGIPRPGQDIDQRLAARPATTTPNPSSTSAPVMPAPPPRWSIRTVELAIIDAMSRNPLLPPTGLNWDLFLGPAPAMPYHPAYHPFSWRGWTDFGVSAIGDMGAHLMDQPYWALDLGWPTSVQSSSTPWGGWLKDYASYPSAMRTVYNFPPRGTKPAVKLTWYDGNLMPLLDADIPFPGGDGGGGIFVGERGYLTYETYGDNPKVYPEAISALAAKVPKTVPRIDVPHEVNWAQACKGQAQASSPFDYAARLTEVMLLGIVALRAGQATRILYDGEGMRVTNRPEVNQWLTREYRNGWSL